MSAEGTFLVWVCARGDVDALPADELRTRPNHFSGDGCLGICRTARTCAGSRVSM